MATIRITGKATETNKRHADTGNGFRFMASTAGGIAPAA